MRVSFITKAPRLIASLVSIAVSCLLTAAPASAIGTITIRQSDGDVNVYKDVEIKVIHGALYLTSDDGNGTIIVNRAACSYQGKVLVCFATGAALVQEGEASALDLKTGTVYLNSTGDAQPLVLSSAKLPGHSIMLLLSTNLGTYITVHGRIDEVVQ
jgi:hypothetical protein